MRQEGNISSRQTAPLNISAAYQEPVFEEKERIHKIIGALAESHKLYAETAEVNHLPAVVYGLVVDDSLVFWGGYGTANLESGTAATEHTLFRIASMSKSFTAMAVLMLRDDGLLSLHDPVSAYLPELKQLTYLTGDASPVSICNLLTMTAGFPEDNPWGDRFLDISDEALTKLVEEGIYFSNIPSMHYEYSNLGFGLLGLIISRVSGMPFQEYITRNILEPLGMKHTLWEFSEAPEDLLALGYSWENGNWIPQPMLHDGAFGAMGGLITSVADFSKYVSLHLSAWPPRSDPPDDGPVKRSTLREMHHMYNPGFYSDPERFGENKQSLLSGYGLGLRVIKDQQGVFEVGHNGGLPGFGSSYVFYPEHGIGIMAFGNLTYTGGMVKSANYKVIESLMDQELFQPRIQSVSPILAKRKEQVAELILHWDARLEKEIVAANLYLDRSRERRMAEARDILSQCGEIVSVGPVEPENQLRGSFLMLGSQRNVQVFFTLTPEAEPRVQWLTLELIP